MISEGILTCRRCESRYPWRPDFTGDPSICDECKKKDEVERLQEEKEKRRVSIEGFKIIPTNQPFKQTKEEKQKRKTGQKRKNIPSWAWKWPITI